MKTTNFNLKESITRNGKTMATAVSKELPAVAVTYAAAIVAGTIANTAIEAVFAKKTNNQIKRIMNK